MYHHQTRPCFRENIWRNGVSTTGRLVSSRDRGNNRRGNNASRPIYTGQRSGMGGGHRIKEGVLASFRLHQWDRRWVFLCGLLDCYGWTRWGCEKVDVRKPKFGLVMCNKHDAPHDKLISHPYIPSTISWLIVRIAAVSKHRPCAQQWPRRRLYPR